MIDYWQLLLLGLIAGFTIFLGLPVAALRNLSAKKKGFLNAFALGILVFLIIDVFSHAWESAEGSATDALGGKIPVGNAVIDLIAMFGGIAIGLIGLVLYENKMMRRSFPQIISLDNIKIGDEHLHQLVHKANAYKLAMIIPFGIGSHNFS